MFHLTTFCINLVVVHLPNPPIIVRRSNSDLIREESSTRSSFDIFHSSFAGSTSDWTTKLLHDNEKVFPMVFPLLPLLLLLLPEILGRDSLEDEAIACAQPTLLSSSATSSAIMISFLQHHRCQFTRIIKLVTPSKVGLGGLSPNVPSLCRVQRALKACHLPSSTSSVTVCSVECQRVCRAVCSLGPVLHTGKLQIARSELVSTIFYQLHDVNTK